MLSGQVEVQAALTEALTAILGSTPSWGLNYNPQFNFLNGVGANQADTIYSGQRTIASSGSPDSVKLTVTLKDPLGPTATKAQIDVTDLSSTAKQFLGGLADFGQMTVEIHYIPGNAVHTAIRNDFINAASPVHNWKLLFVNSHQWAFQAFVMGFPGNTQMDATQKGTITLRLTGPVVET